MTEFMEAGDLHSALRRDSTKALLWYRRRVSVAHKTTHVFNLGEQQICRCNAAVWLSLSKIWPSSPGWYQHSLQYLCRCQILRLSCQRYICHRLGLTGCCTWWWWVDVFACPDCRKARDDAGTRTAAIRCRAWASALPWTLRAACTSCTPTASSTSTSRRRTCAAAQAAHQQRMALGLWMQWQSSCTACGSPMGLLSQIVRMGDELPARASRQISIDNGHYMVQSTRYSPTHVTQPSPCVLGAGADGPQQHRQARRPGSRAGDAGGCPDSRIARARWHLRLDGVIASCKPCRAMTVSAVSRLICRTCLLACRRVTFSSLVGMHRGGGAVITWGRQ